MRANPARPGRGPGRCGVAVSEDQQQFAAYTADMAGALARVARSKKLETLAYLLDMVRLEAQSAAGDDLGEVPELN